MTGGREGEGRRREGERRGRGRRAMRGSEEGQRRKGEGKTDMRLISIVQNLVMGVHSSLPLLFVC